MSQIEDAVAQHYTTGALTERLRAALEESGVDPDAATVADLKAGDEFHTGGVLATDHLFAQLAPTHATRVLDVGCGIGGTSRYIADRYDSTVTGVDLTPEFVETATELSDIVGLSEKTSFLVGSALELPVADAAFDLAVMLHVGMNIEDKTALFSEAARALATSGTFALFDVMGGEAAEPLDFPLPWSTMPGTSFVDAPDVYRDAAAAAGLELVAESDRTDFALTFFEEVFARIAESGPAPLGIHLMMGETAPEKFKNYVTNLKAGRIRPTEMIFKKTG
ncbi:methyltransferase domain-containing protein [Rhodobacteraceae bacterium B1Z28]|uniref:Methyltransferase domain-containing protein n=1 Tax=Ruegeria haliotis TaxID=2747601 RepID=A0ABX2PLB8_9RHOB|nr:methyltransferase domain-containing protein [Ruegeria haliotis]NVO54913.1 methyltransferase domain-containing protein [Ruegeria haliotis]